MRRWVALACGLAAVACTATQPHPAAAPSPKAAHCGYERWHVKVGSDPTVGKVNLTPTASTITALTALTSPLPPVTGKYPPQTPRQPQEQRTVTLTATLVAYSIEQDDDFHLVLMDAFGRSMIAEIPAPACVPATSPFARGVTQSRAAFIAATGYNPPEPAAGQYAPPFTTSSLPVAVSGVVFFDFVHGQRGVAGNGVELHPVLSITFGGHPSPTPTPTHRRHRPTPTPTTTG